MGATIQVYIMMCEEYDTALLPKAKSWRVVRVRYVRVQDQKARMQSWGLLSIGVIFLGDARLIFDDRALCRITASF